MPDASEDCAEAGSLRAGPYPKSHCNGGPTPTPNSFSSGPKSTSPVLGGGMPDASEDCAEAGSLRAGPYPKSHCNGGPTPHSRGTLIEHIAAAANVPKISQRTTGEGGDIGGGGVSSTTRSKQSTPTTQGIPMCSMNTFFCLLNT